MSDTSTKRAEEIAYNLQLSGVSGSTWGATEVDASNMLRALAAERDALRAALQSARRDGREEAARRVEKMWLIFREKDNGASDWIFQAYDDIPTGDDFVAAIRALGEKE